MSTVITIESIKREIDKVPVEKLKPLYEYVRSLSAELPKKQTRESFLAKMSEIRIEGPPDFATNIDEYLYGDKRLNDDIR